jgi:hypothetical protein
MGASPALRRPKRPARPRRFYFYSAPLRARRRGPYETREMRANALIDMRDAQDCAVLDLLVRRDAPRRFLEVQSRVPPLGPAQLDQYRAPVQRSGLPGRADAYALSLGDQRFEGADRHHQCVVKSRPVVAVGGSGRSDHPLLVSEQVSAQFLNCAFTQQMRIALAGPGKFDDALGD